MRANAHTHTQNTTQHDWNHGPLFSISYRGLWVLINQQTQSQNITMKVWFQDKSQARDKDCNYICITSWTVETQNMRKAEVWLNIWLN